MLTSTLFVILALLAEGLAKPTPVHRTVLSFPLTRVDQDLTHLETWEKVQLEHAYVARRHGSGDGVTKRDLSPRLTDVNLVTAPSLWTVQLQLGSSKVAANLQIDSGSSDLWSTKYDASKSTTSKPVAAKPFSIKYADQSTATGTCYTDNVYVSTLTATGQGVCAAQGNAASDSGTDGLIGVGFQSGSAVEATDPNGNVQQVPIVQNLFNQGSIPKAVYGLRLSKDNAGWFIGGTETARAMSALSYDGVSGGEWQVPFGGIWVGNTQVIAPSDNQLALIDSGTTAIVGPRAGVEKLFKAIPGAMSQAAYYAAIKDTTKPTDGSYVIPCDYVPDGKLQPRGTSLGFTLASKTWYLSYANFAGGGNYNTPVNGIYYCSAQISWSASIDSTTQWIVGGTFMSTMYNEFDYTNNRIGFAYGS